uniref:Mucin n=1 Tax=Rhipicephalus appendiculatus TaxID=34631 RepID=A0A131YUW8_RHIAP
MASTQFACRECSMQFSGPMPYMDHLKSARHQKKVAAHRLLTEMAAGGAPVNSSLDIITAASSPVAATQSPQIAPLPFVCKLCDVAMNCEDALIAHNKGKKHQRTLQREEVLRQLAAAKVSPLPSAVISLPSATTPPMSPPTSTVSESPQEQQEQNGEVIDLSCRVCGIVLFENVGYKLEHLETEAHRKKKMQVAGGLTPATSGLKVQSQSEPLEADSDSK